MGKVLKKEERKNVVLWISRDIDGEELEKLTYENCLEIEYRSQIASDYGGPKFNEEFYAETIELLYNFGSYIEITGKIYHLKNKDLKLVLEKIWQSY